MGFVPEQVVAHLSSVIDDRADSTNDSGYLEDYDLRRIATRARDAIRRYAPPGSAYVEDAEAVARDDVSDTWRAQQLCAIAHALRDDYANGGLLNIQEIVHADLFDDLLEMGTELLDKGFVGPAAVLAGSVLEGHLRKLAEKHEVSSTDQNRSVSVEALGIELRKADVVTGVQRKAFQAWYAQRTEAAHGRAENLVAPDVARMIEGIRDFIGRHPA